ncbi:MAG: lamin tail domain-containing protein [Planctomycetes bacterium]|nr:lamin tail domain-containing protein [Planctomycetota bacterium]
MTRQILAIVALGALAPSAGAITITEIHYHPRPADGDAEFIEFYNDRSIPVDIGGFALVDGVRYTFPEGTVFAPRSYIVVAGDPARILSLYGVEAFGPWDGKLDNGGERVTLAREGGGTVISVRYREGEEWPEGADGFGPSLVLRATVLDPNEGASWAPSPEMGGSPGRANGMNAEAFDTPLVRVGATWRFHKGTTAPPADWKSADFDDAGWLEGASGFGYDDDDDATELLDMQNRYLAVFARVEFRLGDPPPDALILSIRYDDGFAAWIDGIPIARAGLPDDPIPFDETASPSHEATNPVEFDATAVAAQLGPGLHVLAVEGHNAAINSSDFSLEPALIAREIAPEGGPPRELVINEVRPGPSGDGWIELYNRGDRSLSIGGVGISSIRGEPGRYRMSAGATLAPGAFLLISEMEMDIPLWPDDGELAVFVISEDGSRLLDSHRILDPPGAGASFGRFPDGEGEWWVLTEATPGEANAADAEDDVVINEIMYHPIGDDDPLDPDDPDPEDLQYVELYNRGERTIDLTGWRFARGIDYTFPARSIAPGEFLVVAKSPARVRAVYGLAEDVVLGPFGGELADDGELLRLVDRRGNLADSVRYYDEGEWDEWADGLGSSLELIDPRADNGSASAWAASDETHRAPWTDIEYTSSRFGMESEIQFWLMGKGTILIDDLSVSSSGTEYIGGGDFESGITRWAFRGTHVDSFLTTEDATSGTHSLRIEASGRGEQRWNYIEVDTARTLTSGRAYTISYRARWLRGMPVILCRQHGHGLARTTHLDVPADLGTPGRENGRRRANAGPTLDGLVQTPVLPEEGQSVAIRIRAADPDGLVQVRVLYRDQAASSFSSLDLADDGLHGDLDAGDGIHGGSIPPFGANRRVEFRIEASDALGETTLFPRNGSALYIVPATMPNRKVTTCQLVMTDRTYEELTTRPLMSNQLLPATFVVGDEAIYHDIRFRYRGSPYIRPNMPCSHRIRFWSDNPYRGRVTHMNLDSQVQDATRQHERAVFYMLRKLAVSRTDVFMPYSLDDFLVVDRNGTRLALFEDVERVDGEFVQRWWPGDDDGYLLKVNVQTEFQDSGSFQLIELASFQYRGEDEEEYRLLFNMFSHEERDDFFPLIDLCLTIARTTGTALEEAVGERALLRNWADQMAGRLYVADWDTFGLQNGHNIYMYYGALGRRWVMIPWDADLTFGDTNAPIDIGSPFPATRKIFSRPANLRMLMGAHYRLMTEVATPERIGPELDRVYAAIGADGASTPSSILSFLQSRAAVVRGRLPAATFRITTNGGEDFEADDASVRLAGTAPLDVDRIVLNGEPVDDRFEFTGVTVWRMDLDLAVGANRFTFEGFDHQGTLVGTASILIHSPGAAFRIDAVVPNEGPKSGGTRVRIQGNGFEEGLTVLFGGVVPPEATVLSPTEIEAVTPASMIGAFPVEVTVINPGGRSTVLLNAFRYTAGSSFVRGDANGDALIDLADAISILSILFASQPSDCEDAADTNDDGRLDLGDAISLLDYLYAAGAPPAAPFPEPGADPTPGDPLGCGR